MGEYHSFTVAPIWPNVLPIRFWLGPPLSGLLDKFALFTRLVCQTNILNLFCLRKKPCLIGDSHPGPLGFKSEMLPTEPLGSAQYPSSYWVENQLL
jgi:hypothetical protein